MDARLFLPKLKQRNLDFDDAFFKRILTPLFSLVYQDILIHNHIHVTVSFPTFI